MSSKRGRPSGAALMRRAAAGEDIIREGDATAVLTRLSATAIPAAAAPPPRPSVIFELWLKDEWAEERLWTDYRMAAIGSVSS